MMKYRQLLMTLIMFLLCCSELASGLSPVAMEAELRLDELCFDAVGKRAHQFVYFYLMVHIIDPWQSYL